MSFSNSKKEFIPIFWNLSFNKGTLKNFVSWCFQNYGQRKTIKILEKLQLIGFGYATKAGVSISIDDLQIPPTKSLLLAESDQDIEDGLLNYQKSRLTGLERFQRIIETWHNTSESLKDEMIKNFRKIDILNPVFMMAFSGARGNVSQVRQLVSMRGLMSDPQGKILSFPIISNFREGLTLTEYVISCYGARKGVVDTALRTANAGYLTRRLVDVAQHVIVLKFDCGTKKGFYLTEMKKFNKTLYPLRQRLLGRVLAANIYKSSSNINTDYSNSDQKNMDYKNKEIIGFRNEEISATLAEKIAKVTNKVFIRSPLTCQTPRLVCQLCYGWSLSEGYLVAIGEAVGVIAAQSIGEPGTQLTMRTFHTGGVFSGEMFDQLISPYDGFVYYPNSIPGTLIRTTQGKIAFLTKIEGKLSICKTKSISQSFKLPAYTVLFARNNEKIIKDQLIAELSFLSPTVQKTGEIGEFVVKSEMEGQLCSGAVNVLETYTEYNEIMTKSIDWGFVWILSGKICQLPINAAFFALPGDLVHKHSTLSQIKWNVPMRSVVDTNLLVNEVSFIQSSFRSFQSKFNLFSSSKERPNNVLGIHSKKKYGDYMQKKWLNKPQLYSLNSFLNSKLKLNNTQKKVCFYPLSLMEKSKIKHNINQKVFTKKLFLPDFKNGEKIHYNLLLKLRTNQQRSKVTLLPQRKNGESSTFFKKNLWIETKQWYESALIKTNISLGKKIFKENVELSSSSFLKESLEKKKYENENWENSFHISKNLYIRKNLIFSKKEKISINLPLIFLPISTICYKKIGYFFLFENKTFSKRELTDSLTLKNYCGGNNVLLTNLTLQEYHNTAFNRAQIDALFFQFYKKRSQKIDSIKNSFYFKNSVLNQIVQKKLKNIFFIQERKFSHSLKIIGNLSNEIGKLNLQSFGKTEKTEKTGKAPFVAPFVPIILKGETPAVGKAPGVVQDVFFMPNYLNETNLNYGNSQTKKLSNVKLKLRFKDINSLFHWFPKMYLTKTGGKYFYLVTYDFFSHFGEKTYSIKSNLLARIFWVNWENSFIQSDFLGENWENDLGKTLGGVRPNYFLGTNSLRRSLRPNNFKGGTKKIICQKNDLGGELRSLSMSNVFSPKENTLNFQVNNLNISNLKKSLDYLYIKSYKNKYFNSWFLTLLSAIFITKNSLSKKRFKKYFYTNLKHFCFKNEKIEFQNLKVNYTLYKKTLRWNPSINNRNNYNSLNLKNVKSLFEPSEQTQFLFRNGNSGWIYKPRNLSLSISLHKKFFLPGQIIIDDLIFDNSPIYIECIPENVLAKMFSRENFNRFFFNLCFKTKKKIIEKLEFQNKFIQSSQKKYKGSFKELKFFNIKKLVKTINHRFFNSSNFSKKIYFNFQKKSRGVSSFLQFSSLLSFSQVFIAYLNYYFLTNSKIKLLNFFSDSFVLVIKPVTEYPLYKPNFYKTMLYKFQKKSSHYLFHYSWIDLKNNKIFSKILQQNYHSTILNKQNQSLKLLDTFPTTDLFLKVKWKGIQKNLLETNETSCAHNTLSLKFYFLLKKQKKVLKNKYFQISPNYSKNGEKEKNLSLINSLFSFNKRKTFSKFFSLEFESKKPLQLIELILVSAQKTGSTILKTDDIIVFKFFEKSQNQFLSLLEEKLYTAQKSLIYSFFPIWKKTSQVCGKSLPNGLLDSLFVPAFFGNQPEILENSTIRDFHLIISYFLVKPFDQNLKRAPVSFLDGRKLFSNNQNEFFANLFIDFSYSSKQNFKKNEILCESHQHTSNFLGKFYGQSSEFYQQSWESYLEKLDGQINFLVTYKKNNILLKITLTEIYFLFSTFFSEIKQRKQMSKLFYKIDSSKLKQNSVLSDFPLGYSFYVSRFDCFFDSFFSLFFFKGQNYVLENKVQRKAFKLSKINFMNSEFFYVNCLNKKLPLLFLSSVLNFKQSFQEVTFDKQVLNSKLLKNKIKNYFNFSEFETLIPENKQSEQSSNILEGSNFDHYGFKPNFYFNYYQKYPLEYFVNRHSNNSDERSFPNPKKIDGRKYPYNYKDTQQKNFRFFHSNLGNIGSDLENCFLFYKILFIFQNNKSNNNFTLKNSLDPTIVLGSHQFDKVSLFSTKKIDGPERSERAFKFLRALSIKQLNSFSFIPTIFQQPCFEIFLTTEMSFGYNQFQNFQFSKNMYNLQMKGLSAKLYFNTKVNQHGIALTRYLSPFLGEILRHDIKSYWLQNSQKNRYLMLTKKDQKAFSLISNFNHQTKLDNPYFSKNQTILGKIIARGDYFNFNNQTLGSSSESGIVIHFNNSKITLRKAQSFLLSSNCIFHYSHGDLVEKNKPLLSLPYKQLKTGDIVQGIPKVEQLLEARSTFKGKEEEDNLHKLLNFVFERYKTKFSLKLSVRKSLSFIQLILVNSVQRIYRSQGVSISDKHLEVIVKQMTSKVYITSRGDSSFFRGEHVDLYIVEMWNSLHPNLKKITYKPLLLGISRSSLEVNSFLSAASFQHTKKVLSRSAFKTNIDFLNGLKENVIIGNLISAGTGNVRVNLS
nr:RNA polymerase beta'' subunit [Uronema sp. CCAP 334/1]